MEWVSLDCFLLFCIIRVQKAGGTQEITKALWTGIRLQEMNLRRSGGYYTGIRKLQLALIILEKNDRLVDSIDCMM